MSDANVLIGPFTQIVTMRDLPKKGALSDDHLEIIDNGGVVISNGLIIKLGLFEELKKNYQNIELIEGPRVLMPGLIDCHTHICFDGSRAMDFALRNSGVSYLEIANAGGGIWSTVRHTRAATQDRLTELTAQRMDQLLKKGVTTVEVKSGYGLNVTEELKMLRAIRSASEGSPIDAITTCLAAHIVPKDVDLSASEYMEYVLKELVPVIIEENLCKRFDVFIEDSAFTPEISESYLNRLKELGFDLTVHGDQFTTGGSAVAVSVGARSVDHLEVSGDKEIALLANSEVVAVALPGASIGIGCQFTPVRKLLDAGCAVAIASDWNPGSAPQGDLMTQAAILAAYQKLSTAEVFAAITTRAALALGLEDRGQIAVGYLADLVSFPTEDYREILYKQGSLVVSEVWKRGVGV